MTERKHRGWSGNALWRWVAAAALAVLSLNVLAFEPYPDFTFAPAGGGMGGTVGKGAAADWAAATKGSEAGNLVANLTRKIPFEPPASGAFKMIFTPRNIAKGMATGAAVLIPMFANDAFQYLMGQACVRVAGGAMQLAPGGQWEECHFSTGTAYWIPGYPEADTLSPTHDAACQAHLNKHFAWLNGHAADVVNNAVSTGDSQPGTHSCRLWTNDFNNYYTQGGYNTDTMQVQDGYQATTPQAAEDKLTNAATADAGSSDPAAVARLQAVLDAEFAAGQPVDGMVAAPGTIAPVLTPGKVTTTQNPDGTTTTSQDQIENDYSCTVINDGQAVSCSQYQKTTTTTTTLTPSTPTTSATTSTSTTTTTITKDPAQADGTDPCKTDPDRVGCHDLGPVDTTAIPKVTKNITWAQETLFGGGSCPAPQTWSDSAGTHAISYQPVCDFVTSVCRPILLAFASLTAIFIVGGFRTGTGD